MGESAAANVEKCMIDDDPRGPIALSPQKAGEEKEGKAAAEITRRRRTRTILTDWPDGLRRTGGE